MILPHPDLIRAKAAAGALYWLSELLHKVRQDPGFNNGPLDVHVAAKYGYATLDRFHLGASDFERIENCRDCLIALATNDFSKLKGQPEPAAPTENLTVTINGEPSTPSQGFEKMQELVSRLKNVTVNVDYHITIIEDKK